MNCVKEFGGLSTKAIENLSRFLRQESDIWDLDFRIWVFRKLLWLYYAELKQGDQLGSCCHDPGER